MSDPSNLNDLIALQQAIAAGQPVSDGISAATLVEWVGSLIFGMIGYFAYQTGKERQWIVYRLNGLAMMIYPYLCSGAWMYVAGVLLCVALYCCYKLEI